MQKSGLSFYHVIPRDQTQVARLETLTHWAISPTTVSFAESIIFLFYPVDPYFFFYNLRTLASACLTWPSDSQLSPENRIPFGTQDHSPPPPESSKNASLGMSLNMTINVTVIIYIQYGARRFTSLFCGKFHFTTKLSREKILKFSCMKKNQEF